jgi:uncharacterized protein Yka (UPF0111/DUF47 family)
VLHKAVTALFTDIDAVFQLTRDVDKVEGEIDELERQLIRAIFDLEDAELSYKNLLHRTIRSMCDISDKTENVADRLSILAAKRRI